MLIDAPAVLSVGIAARTRPSHRYQRSLRNRRRRGAEVAGRMVGRMIAGERLVTPKAEPLAGDFLKGRPVKKCADAFRSFYATISSADWRRYLPRKYCRWAVLTEGFLPARRRARMPLDQCCRPSRRAGTGGEKGTEPAWVRFGAESVCSEPLLRTETFPFKRCSWRDDKADRCRDCRRHVVLPSRSTSIRVGHPHFMRLSACVYWRG